MKDPYSSVAKRLTNVGFREVELGCFTSATNPRVIGLALCPPDVESWYRKTEELLRKKTMRLALTWARYIILLVGERKTSSLAWSAASFAQEVSSCRRIVLFLGPDAEEDVALPFVGLPPLRQDVDAPPRDIEPIVQSVLSTKLAEAFLNEDLATSRIQALAEEDES